MDKTQDTIRLSESGLQSTNPFVFPHGSLAWAPTSHSPALSQLKLEQALLHKRLLCATHATTAQHRTEKKDSRFVPFFQLAFVICRSCHFCRSWGWRV